MSRSKQEIQELVDSVPGWFHSIDVGQGVVTPGFKTPAILEREVASLAFPDLHGKSVLDINTWDGFYAFEAERRGAASVTALDSFVWTMDLAEFGKHHQECVEKGIVSPPPKTLPFYKPDELPGKRGFDIAHELRGSRVQSVVADFMETDVGKLGEFDVTFFLGSLYHMEDPLGSLRRLSAVTREMAVIETEAMELPNSGDRAFCEFFETNELGDDVTNWWSPNRQALIGMCRAAGFRRVEVLTAPRVKRIPSLRARRRRRRKTIRYRAVAHAWK